MKKNRLFCALFVLMALGMTSCLNQGDNQKQTIGTGAGAVIGGLLGSMVGDGKGKMWAVGVGTALGAFLGSRLGSKLDESDRALANQATQVSLERNISGTSSNWSNPDTGRSGTITPGPVLVDHNNQDPNQSCRPYTHTIFVDGQAETAEGIACRGLDGIWQIQ